MPTPLWFLLYTTIILYNTIYIPLLPLYVSGRLASKMAAKNFAHNFLMFKELCSTTQIKAGGFLLHQTVFFVSMIRVGIMRGPSYSGLYGCGVCSFKSFVWL